MLNQFRIFNPKFPNRLITEKDWGRFVFPGSTLAMSVIVDGVCYNEKTCPRCKNKNDIIKGQGFIEW